MALNETTESKFQKHILRTIVKFKELKNEYELRVKYDTKNGYKVKSNDSNKEKPSIKVYLDGKTSRGIVIALKEKVDFLP